MTELQLNHIYLGDTLTTLKTFPDESIDCVMTSPPYWALRDYGTANWEGGNEPNCVHLNAKEHSRFDYSLEGCPIQKKREGTDAPHWKEVCPDCGAKKIDYQLGLETTFQEYIVKLCAIFDEIKRVLKKEGTCWVNLGDTYIGSPSGSTKENYDKWGKEGDGLFKRLGSQNSNDFSTGITPKPRNSYPDPKNPEALRAREQIEKSDLPDKCLTLIPMRFAIEMVNRGWIIRNDCVWYKRNSMPTSVKDRFATKWEHVFLFVKSRKYYFDIDSIRKPHLASSINRINAGFSDKVSFNYRVREATKGTLQQKFGDMYSATEEEKAKYNSKGEIYKSINDRKAEERANGTPHDLANCNPKGGNPGDIMFIDEEPSDFWDITTQPHPFAHFACYPERLCETPIKAGCPENGIVLDLFMGSGTTALVALKLNRKFVGIELNQKYIEIANKRLKPYLNQQKIGENYENNINEREIDKESISGKIEHI